MFSKRQMFMFYKSYQIHTILLQKTIILDDTFKSNVLIAFTEGPKKEIDPLKYKFLPLTKSSTCL